jgi:hypothetical protein
MEPSYLKRAEVALIERASDPMIKQKMMELTPSIERLGFTL